MSPEEERRRSQTLPQRRQERLSARPFQAAPIVDLDEEDAGESEKKGKVRRFFRAIGRFFGGGSKRDDEGERRRERQTISGRLSRFSRRAPDKAALRAITIEDARYAFNNNPLDSDNGSVYSSQYGGSVRPPNPYVLFLGTEKQTNFKPNPTRGRSNTDDTTQIMDLSELRPSMHERQLPVFFVPPPADIVASVTPRRKSFRMYDSPPDSPHEPEPVRGVFA